MEEASDVDRSTVEILVHGKRYPFPATNVEETIQAERLEKLFTEQEEDVQEFEIMLPVFEIRSGKLCTRNLNILVLYGLEFSFYYFFGPTNAMLSRKPLRNIAKESFLAALSLTYSTKQNLTIL